MATAVGSSREVSIATVSKLELVAEIMLFFPTKSTDFADFHPKMKINVRNKTIYYYSTVVELQNRRRGCDRPAISLYCTASIQGSLNTSISARVAVDLQSFMVGHWLVVVGRVDEL